MGHPDEVWFKPLLPNVHDGQAHHPVQAAMGRTAPIQKRGRDNDRGRTAKEHREPHLQPPAVQGGQA
eukprot:5470795-Heterocapsa_arctica.AAC.1